MESCSLRSSCATRLHASLHALRERKCAAVGRMPDRRRRCRAQARQLLGRLLSDGNDCGTRVRGQQSLQRTPSVRQLAVGGRAIRSRRARHEGMHRQGVPHDHPICDTQRVQRAPDQRGRRLGERLVSRREPRRASLEPRNGPCTTCRSLVKARPVWRMPCHPAASPHRMNSASQSRCRASRALLAPGPFAARSSAQTSAHGLNRPGAAVGRPPTNASTSRFVFTLPLRVLLAIRTCVARSTHR